MKKTGKYYIIITMCVYSFLFAFLPDRSEISQIFISMLVLPLILAFFAPRLISLGNNGAFKVNCGLIFLGIMSLIMVIGNVNNFVTRYVLPDYGDNISLTNYFWMAGMVLFALGYIHFCRFWSHRNIEKNHTKILELSPPFLFGIFTLTAFATFYSFISLGFVPFISGASTGFRFGSQIASTSLVLRLWNLCAISAVLGFIYFLWIRKDPIVFFIVILSSLFSLFLGTRFTFAIIGTSAFLISLILQRNKRHAYVMAFLIIGGFMVCNFVYLIYREPFILENRIMANDHLNFAHKIISTTFNEYSQLNFVLNSYDGELKYGDTFLSIPASFIPAPLLGFFGINKQEILDNNSACLLAEYLFSTSSRGIRTGILGEAYFNFGYYGFLLMYIVGCVVGFLQMKINTTNYYDYRFGFHIIFFVLMIYALLGQINSIGYVLTNYLLLYLFVGIAMRSVRKNPF